MKRLVAAGIIAVAMLGAGAVNNAAHADASPVGHHKSWTPDVLCTPDPVNGGKVCARIRWTPSNDRYAKRLVRRVGLPVKGQVTYLGYTYRDVQDGHDLFSIRVNHHYYLYVVA